MKEALKILYVAQELTPYVPETIMAKVCRELPQYAQEQGVEIRIFMPCYGIINERRNQLHEVQRLSGMNLIIDDSDHPLIIKVATLPSARMQVYFIDNEDFFHRRGTIVDAEGNEYDDNAARMVFFARGVLETIKKLRWTPNLIHCNGWMSALVPLYVRTAYQDDPFFQHSKIVYSSYNIPFNNTFNNSLVRMVQTKGVDREQLTIIDKAVVSHTDIVRIAAAYADAIDAAAPERNEEIAAIAQEQNIQFAPYADDFKQKYLQLYAKIDPDFDMD